MRLDIPDNLTLQKAVARLSTRFARSILPNAMDYRSREKIHGRGQRLGLSQRRSRLKNLHVQRSLIKGEIIYRQDFVAPQRRVNLLVDLRAADKDISTKRLLSCAVVICGALLSDQDSDVVLGAFGSTISIPLVPIYSFAELPNVIKTMAVFANKVPDSHFTSAKLRKACEDTDNRHIIFISHYLNPKLVMPLDFKMGCTTFLVKPPKGRLRAAAGLLNSKYFGLAIQKDLEIHDLYAEYHRQTRYRLGKTFVIPESNTPLAALQELLH